MGRHTNQNATYLKTLTSGTSSSGAPNLLTKGDFEQESSVDFKGWFAYNGASSMSACSGAEEHGGTRSLKATVAAGTEIATRVDNALNDFITKTVTHYKGNVKGWDVVNEPMIDGSDAFRPNSSTTLSNGATNYFFWLQYGVAAGR